MTTTVILGLYWGCVERPTQTLGVPRAVVAEAELQQPLPAVYM